MYIVTRLEGLKNRKYSVVIKSEKESKKFEVSEDIIVEYRLVQEKVLSTSDYKKLVVAIDRDIVYQKVLHFALYKMRCTKEITDFLNKKKIPFEEHKYYLNKLRKSTILDDIKYTDIYVRESFEFRKLGPNKIIYELNKKKISKDIYQQFINDIKEQDIEDTMEYLFNKKLGSIKNKSINTATQNLKQFLITKGYSFETVASFCAKSADLISETINEDDSLGRDYAVALKKYKDSKDKRKNTISYLLRKGYNYSKIKAKMGDEKYEKND